MKKKGIIVIADKGYFSRIDIKASHDLGITVYWVRLILTGKNERSTAVQTLINKAHLVRSEDVATSLCLWFASLLITVIGNGG